MKKNLLTTLLFILTVAASVNTSEAVLCYKMASYGESGSGQNTPQTPLFDLRIFNGTEPGCFQIATQEQTGVTSYNNGIQFLFDLMIGVSIALAVILFTFGAAQGITNDVFGQNMSTKSLKEGKDTMKNSLIGLMIILGMWLVINTINPDLLRLPALQGLYQLNPAGKPGNPSGGVTAQPAS
jgi:hypothetical protein